METVICRPSKTALVAIFAIQAPGKRACERKTLYRNSFNEYDALALAIRQGERILICE